MAVASYDSSCRLNKNRLPFQLDHFSANFIGCAGKISDESVDGSIVETNRIVDLDQFSRIHDTNSIADGCCLLLIVRDIEGSYVCEFQYSPEIRSQPYPKFCI